MSEHLTDNNLPDRDRVERLYRLIQENPGITQARLVELSGEPQPYVWRAVNFYTERLGLLLCEDHQGGLYVFGAGVSA